LPLLAAACAGCWLEAGSLERMRYAAKLRSWRTRLRESQLTCPQL